MTRKIQMISHDAAPVEASLVTIVERDGAIIGRAIFEAEGEPFDVPVVVHSDGTVIQYSDWQAPRLDDERVAEEAGDPAWAHHWTGQHGEPCVIVDGLPRLFAELRS